MSRTIIEHYLELTKDLESPTSFLEWGAISCISAILRDNVWFQFATRRTKVYPNMYVLLLADSAVVRKSAPMDINVPLLRAVNNTKVMAGAASMQGVLRELGNTQQGKPIGGSGVMIAKELKGFLVKDDSTISILTDLYDYQPLYEKYLSTQDMAPVKNVCLSLIAGSNEVMLQSVFDSTATEGGLLGRFFMIQEEKKRKSNSGFEDNAEIISDDHWKPLEAMLREVALVKGPVHFEEDARKLYNDWYHSLEHLNLYTKTGFEGRIHTHVLKIAITLAASKPGFRTEHNLPRKVTMEEIDTAINMVWKLFPNYRKFMLGTGRSPISVAQGQIATALLNAPDHAMTYRDLLNKFFSDIDKETLDKVMENFEAAELVIQRSNKGTPGYKATEKLLNLALMNQKVMGAKVQ